MKTQRPSVFASRQLLANALRTCAFSTAFYCSYVSNPWSFAQEAPASEAKSETKDDSATSDDKPTGNAGQDELDKAIEAKLDANDLDTLQKVIDLAKSALQKGLDEGNQEFAKQLIGATALQKAQVLKAQISQSRLGPRAARRIQEEMESNLKLALENDPKLVGAYELMAALHFINSRRDQAVESISKAIELSDDDPLKQSDLYLQRAIMQSDTDKQIEDVSKATELNPNNANAWQAKVELQVAKGDKEDAYETIKGFLSTDSDNEVAISGAVEMLLQLEKEDEAIEVLNAKLETMPDSTSLLRLRGQAKLFKEDIDAAIEDLTKAIELSPQDVPSYLLRSQAYSSKEPPQLDEAAKDVEEALTLQPGNIMGLQLRATIASMQDRFEEAIADIQLLVRNDPDNVFFLRQLAQLYQADERPSLAIKTCELILKKTPEDWQALRMRGDAYLSMGEQRKAIDDYEKALTHIPEELKESRSGLVNNLSWVLSTSPKDEIRNGKRALELGLEACELTEYKEAHILSTLAAAYAETGDFEKAREWSAKAVEAGKTDDSEQLEQLKEELKSYEENKPWRELQETEEAEKPNVQIEEGVDA